MVFIAKRRKCKTHRKKRIVLGLETWGLYAFLGVISYTDEDNFRQSASYYSAIRYSAKIASIGTSYCSETGLYCSYSCYFRVDKILHFIDINDSVLHINSSSNSEKSNEATRNLCGGRVPIGCSTRLCSARQPVYFFEFHAMNVCEKRCGKRAVSMDHEKTTPPDCPETWDT